MKPLQIAILGCGSRGRTYSRIACSLEGRYQITAAADLVEVRTSAVAELAPEGSVRTFRSAEDLFAAGKLADVLVIATQDADHFGHAVTALKSGYDLLLEKPAAESLARCEELDALARSLGRRIALGFVLRYTPFYRAVKAVVDSGFTMADNAFAFPNFGGRDPDSTMSPALLQRMFGKQAVCADEVHGVAAGP